MPTFRASAAENGRISNFNVRDFLTPSQKTSTDPSEYVGKYTNDDITFLILVRASSTSFIIEAKSSLHFSILDSNALESRIEKCKDDLASIIKDVEDARTKIRNVISSFVYFPTYSDGSVEVFCEGVKKSLTLKFEIRPFSAAEALNVGNVSILTQSVEPKDYVISLKLNGITSTGNGIVLMDIDASDLPLIFTNGSRKFNVLVSIKDASKGWDMISGFIPIVPVVVTNP